MQINPRVKNCIITGGGSGIGFAIAETLVKENCKVVIIGRNYDKLKRAVEKIDSKNIFIVQYDVTDVNKFENIIEKCSDLLGNNVDCLINCAGIKTTSVGKPGLQETEYCYDSVMNTNLKSIIFLTRKFALYLRDNNIKGNILNVSSAQGNAARVVSAYQMAKSCVIKFTRGIAKDFAKYGIVINGIAPGCTYSEMTPRSGNGINKLHANQRTLEPTEIADIACFLLSENAMSIIGDTVFADGGFLSAV